jgi:uncharacterized protein YegL
MTDQTSPPPTVHITFVLDRSGSMHSIRDDVVGGFNQFLDEQKAQPGHCVFSMVQFDQQGYDRLYLAEDLANVRPLTIADFVPRGGTPLYDALARAIGETDARAGVVTPEVHLFAIFTDGEDTASRAFSREQIFVMIEERQARGWTFAYLGANHDAYTASAGIGIKAGSTQSFAGDGVGARSAYGSFSANTSHLRGATAQGVVPDPAQFYSGAGKGAEEDQQRREPGAKATPSRP